MKRNPSSNRTLRKRHKQKMRRPENRRLCTVYGLYDDVGRLRYVGQTQQRLDDRRKWYFRAIRKRLAEGRRLSPVEEWIFKGAKFDIRPIDANGTWDVSEIIHIDRARRDGEELLNVTRGGADTLRDVMR